MICEYCEEDKPDVTETVDPFLADIYHDNSLHWLCGDCFGKRNDQR
jgi:hypothetical protein